MFENKVLLVTGGTGSFGNALVRRFIKEDIKEIRIFSRDEKKQDDMRKLFQDDRLKFFIGDVRDRSSLVHAINGVDYIFHAAALKQVPTCEFFPIEAVKTNIIGTDNVLEEAILQKVKRVICLSTDKAAYPINAMGISKAMMEKVFTAKARMSTETIICGTRYGNVMASRGSVIPLFFDQVKEGKELTITNPNMTRFLMSLDDAVDLVLFAFENGKSGDLFVQKSPASTVEDLAKAIIEITNHHKGMRIIGTRHGEKVYETLLTKEEYVKAEDLGDYYRVPMDQRDLNYDKYFADGEQFDSIDEYHSHNTYQLSIEEIKKKIIQLYEIQPQLKEYLK
ncbi:polysaccharide biosynthesis protein [Erysipelothrix rhusiopathiae]|uniref:UDP-glucose 4-epimerase n=1 Tax=Erysipelothrix rhusiopathiae TaxID=1648 RepID=A0A4V0P1A1_ERYRH|nr:polysaccharide biosynthesis protein [Erysipelothrix rhusiopathiae]AYV34070.1 NAD-dependent epimerase/dehydratase family protein [Erysipelothrix rhusiopathiae]BBE36391.1 UDP-glucose 4-epimerase [Erysipelothrix rhusiopathiae]